MKILHVTENLLGISGIAHVVIHLAALHQAAGHEVAVAFGNHDRNRELDTPNGVHRHLLSWPRFSARHAITCITTLGRLVQEYDIVHIHGLWNRFTESAMTACAFHHRGFVFSPHGALDPWALQHKKTKKIVSAALIQRPLLHHAAAVHALSQPEANDCRNFGMECEFTIIPNGVAILQNPTPVRGSLADFGISPEKIFVLFLGRLHPKKGLELLIPAWKQFVSDYPNYILVVAGDDSGSGYGMTLRKLAETAGIASNILFVGGVYGIQKINLMALADCFVLPSRSEGMPVAVLEALSVGTPCIVSNACNLPEIESHRAGKTCELQISSIADCLRIILSDRSSHQSLRNNARMLAKSKFNWTIISSKSLDAYQLLLQTSNHS